MDHEAAVARAAKFASPKYQMMVATIVVGVTIFVIRQPRSDSARFTHWFTVSVIVLLLVIATWGLIKGESSGQSTKSVRLWALLQISFAGNFGLSLIPKSPATMVLSGGLLAIISVALFFVYKEMWATRAKLRLASAAAATRHHASSRE